MARSTYIYVVERTRDGGYEWHTVAAFTVKHELMRWLRHRESDHENLMVTRFSDGDRAPYADMPITELLAEKCGALTGPEYKRCALGLGHAYRCEA